MKGLQSKWMRPRINFVNVLLGAWVIISPFVLGFTRNAKDTWNNVIVGIAVVLISFAAGISLSARNLNVFAGAWLIVSPFLLAFGRTDLFWNNIILGFLILFFAALNPSERHARATMTPPRT